MPRLESEIGDLRRVESDVVDVELYGPTALNKPSHTFEINAYEFKVN